ncbi:MAG: Proteasome-associated ATPase [Firmicutes bacterium ADurb.Bin506]|jgi:SpoVK/Ycf46/Vps4 family AAA+-type ATPase|nr:MAG: Proteasome-associated ATPase [Firmicutes bacterium ADurb.Bin506]
MRKPRTIGRQIEQDESVVFSSAVVSAVALSAGETAATGERTLPLPPAAGAAGQAFAVREPRFSFEQMVLAPDVMRNIDSVCARIQHHDVLYGEWGLASIDPGGVRVAVNLYGPPGTGKTMCAEALARRFGRPILEVNYADVESKYVGETPKNIRAAFAAAAAAGAVLFFDEADSILGKRMTNVQQSADHAVNVSRAVMLRQMDLFEGIVIFATNLASNYDAAFVRRIPYHVYMPLPDEECRARLWQQLIPAAMPGKDTIPVSVLAEASEGMSGGDIKNAIVLAATRAVQREGPARLLTLEDLTEAIEAVLRARRDVGGGSPWNR